MEIFTHVTLIGILLIFTSCTVTLRTETTEFDGTNVVDKEFFISPKLGIK